MELSELEFLDELPPLKFPDKPSSEYFKDVARVLELAPNKWAKVWVYKSKLSAAQRAAIINKNKQKELPNENFEARSTRDETTSTLYLVYRPS